MDALKDWWLCRRHLTCWTNSLNCSSDRRWRGWSVSAASGASIGPGSTGWVGFSGQEESALRDELFEVVGAGEINEVSSFALIY